MPFPERVPNPRLVPISDLVICEFAGDWGISTALALKIIQAQAHLPFALHIFSGARSRKHQAGISDLEFDRSTHANEDTDGCPRLATGADVQPVSPGIRLSGPAVAQMGAAMVQQGLRWGGGSPVGEDGIPVGVERWHFDLGPRKPP